MAKKNLDGKIVVFPGSFDPFTWGHLEVIQRALNMFERVIVAVGVSGSKQALFSADARVKMIEDACKSMRAVTVTAFEGLAVDFAKAAGAVALIRGLRSEADFTYEMPMALANRQLEKSLETIFIPTNPKYSYVSSTLVKEIARLDGDVTSMVPPSVSKKLAEKLRVGKR